MTHQTWRTDFIDTNRTKQRYFFNSMGTEFIILVFRKRIRDLIQKDILELQATFQWCLEIYVSERAKFLIITEKEVIGMQDVQTKAAASRWSDWL